jgi:hypothetical protein
MKERGLQNIFPYILVRVKLRSALGLQTSMLLRTCVAAVCVSLRCECRSRSNRLKDPYDVLRGRAFEEAGLRLITIMRLKGSILFVNRV